MRDGGPKTPQRLFDVRSNQYVYEGLSDFERNGWEIITSDDFMHTGAVFNAIEPHDIAFLFTPMKGGFFGKAAMEETVSNTLTKTVVGSIDDKVTFEIIDGVRRSKASQLIGNETIPARVINKATGELIEETNVPINRLLSPKDSIEMTNQVQINRWFDTFNKTKSGSIPPPIDVYIGNRGKPIAEVLFSSSN